MASDFDRISSAAVSAADSTALPTTPVSLTSPSLSTTATDQQSSLLKPSIAAAGLSPKLFSHSTTTSRGLSPLLASPPPLTGIAALQEQQSRGQSQNPAAVALSTLLSSQSGMSTSKDAPAATINISSGLAAAASSMTTMDGQKQGGNAPISGESLAGKATTATANDTGSGPSKFGQSLDTARAHDPELSNRNFSLGGLSSGGGDTLSSPVRGMSLPGAWTASGSPRAGGRGEGHHKCSYCDQRFTRQHNLKSHLLTHSQEKPYSCDQCAQRFRRLHDLKRHSKLHTGERPHICEICGRKFARGDALNRHTKGAGGCAGRRGSIDGLPEDDYRLSQLRSDRTEDSMDGLIYGNQNDGEFERIDSEHEASDRRISLPNLKAQGVSVTDHAPRQASTYPPVNNRELAQTATSRMYPSGVRQPSSSENTTSSAPTAPTSISSGGNSVSTSLFSTGGISESPRPLSPHAQHPLSQSHYNRHGTHATPPVDLPPIPATGGSSHPQLPALPGLRNQFSSASNMATPPSMPAPSIPPPLNPVNQGDSTNIFNAGFEGVYSYVRTLEEKLTRLQEEVTSLKAHVATLTPSESR